jgi:hypothetical protein
MGGNEERLKHSDYPRDGYKLDIGRLWEVLVDQSLRTLNVYANADGIRIKDTFCGEWEIAERNAVRLSVTEARALGEILLAAADLAAWQDDNWRSHSKMADPDPELNRLMGERSRKLDRELEREREPVEHSQFCPDCIADAEAIGKQEVSE